MELSADASPPTVAWRIFALAYTTPREPRHSLIRTLFTAHDTQPRLLHSQLAPAALVRVSLEPLAAIGTLLISVFAFDETFGGAYLILVLLVFALTFPGTSPRSVSVAGLVRDILANWFAIVALLLLLGWATQTLDAFDLRVIVAWTLATPLALFFTHRLMPAVLPRLLAAEGLQRVAVIAGGGELGSRLAERIRTTPFLGIRFVGYFDDRGPERMRDVEPEEFLGRIEELADYVKTHRVDLIYITLPMASQPRMLRLLDELRDTTVSIYFTPDIFLSDLIQARMDAIGGIPVVAVCETPFYGINGLIKRASDVILASMILVLIFPLLLAIAIGVKLSSPGPALFKQRRYGLDGKEIIVYKFRSMTVLEDGNAIRQATRNDLRVTPFGALLRRYSLDELPQFINVLQGRMSVVGPRPHAVAHNELYRKLIKSYMIRHKVKPGITGWAQVNGLRGETDNIDKMKARIEHDLAYLRNWSLRLDLQIVSKTIVVALRNENAY
jgi:putative colanic acid biosysnthesis UDP-glucose lipid carrier transferase